MIGDMKNDPKWAICAYLWLMLLLLALFCLLFQIANIWYS